MALVAGIDSSTQSCKVVVRDADTGALVRSGRASHPDGTEVAPWHWWDALQSAIVSAGGLDDVAAVSVGGQQHGMVALDAARRGGPRRAAVERHPLGTGRPAELVDGAAAAPQAWADAVGSVPVASLTVTKLRWLRDAEPENAARVAAVALPHDWLTWRLAGRRPAPRTRCVHRPLGRLRHRLLVARHRGLPATTCSSSALGHDALVPARARARPAGRRAPEPTGGAAPRPRCRRQRRRGPRRSACSPATSPSRSAPPGVVSAIASARDGRRLRPGHRVRRRRPAASSRSPARSTRPACSTPPPGCSASTTPACPRWRSPRPPGADGLVLVPYLEGERTPNKPDATGALHGMRLGNTTPRAPGARRRRGHAVRARRRARRAARPGRRGRAAVRSSAAARSPRPCGAIAPSVLGLDVRVPTPGEYVADGAARQAAWVLSGSATPPSWSSASEATVFTGDPVAAGPRAVRRGARADGRTTRLSSASGHDESPAPPRDRALVVRAMCQCDASYAALTSAEMRPRSDTWCPCSLAHSRIAWASLDDERRPRAAVDFAAVRPPTLRA